MSILANPKDEAARVLEVSSSKKVVLRLIGGVAIFMRCPSASREPFMREYVDIDFVGRAKQSKDIASLFTGIGYSPREKFNAMMGAKRLIFNDLVNSRRADIFLDVFEMCHKFDFRKRLELEPFTLPLADLLATKLQIVQINEKDIKDILLLLLDHEIGRVDGEEINGDYLAGLCANDWGIYKTFMTNLSKIQAVINDYPVQRAEREKVGARIERLVRMIEERPKSLSWKLRAKIGERVPWYELPEPDRPVVVG